MISDEQYNASKGVVRCGTCREKFKVSFLTNEEVNRLNTANSNHDIIISDHSQPKHKSELLRILSEHAEREEAMWETTTSSEERQDETLTAAGDTLNTADILLAQTKNKTAPSWEIETEKTELLDESNLNEPTLPSLSNDDLISLENDDDLQIDKNSPPEPSFVEELIKQELAIENNTQNLHTDNNKNKISKQVELELNINSPNELIDLELKGSGKNLPNQITDEDRIAVQQELDNIDGISQSSLDESSKTLTLNEDNLISDDLIDEVDILINEKVITTNTSSNLPFNLTPHHNKNMFKTFVLSIPALLFLLVLSGLFAYQLWLKQLLPDSYNKTFIAAQNYLTPAAEKLGYSFPVKQDLNNLRLLSAVTEAHPTRASTILLRVNFINRAKIEQPLPRLELSLMNEDGRLVSRRTFSPDDYIYNNATNNSIQADELKKVTIELLAFPEQAHGYELKLVSKH